MNGTPCPIAHQTQDKVNTTRPRQQNQQESMNRLGQKCTQSTPDPGKSKHNKVTVDRSVTQEASKRRSAGTRRQTAAASYFLHPVFWACLRSLVALSETWVPASFSGVEEKTLLLLGRLPLFGACSPRCGSCRPPEFRFGLRSQCCVCFFLDLGCFVCTFGPVCSLTPAGFVAAVWWC